MAPRPPAPDTAETRSGARIDPIPPSAIGCSMCSRSQTGVRIMIPMLPPWPRLAADAIRPGARGSLHRPNLSWGICEHDLSRTSSCDVEGGEAAGYLFFATEPVGGTRGAVREKPV